MTVRGLDWRGQRPQTHVTIVAAATCRKAAYLVQHFWYALPEVWLRRIGWCRTPSCETPYFLGSAGLAACQARHSFLRQGIPRNHREEAPWRS